MAIVLRRVGRDTTLQDAGRASLAALGVPRGGAIDRSSAARANRLVGNVDDAAVIETRGDLVVAATTPTWLAFGCRGEAVELARDTELVVHPDPETRWTHLAVRGGFTVPPVLGSRSHDTMFGIGPLPLLDGVRLDVGSSVAGPPPGKRRGDPTPASSCRLELSISSGPDDVEVGGVPRSIDGLEATVVRASDRASVTLAPTIPIAGRPPGVERPILEGAVQVDEVGRLVVALANHPTFSRLPVVGVVDGDCLRRLVHATEGVHASVRAIEN